MSDGVVIGLSVDSSIFEGEGGEGEADSGEERKNLRSDTSDLCAGMVYKEDSFRKSQIRMESSAEPVAIWYLRIEFGQFKGQDGLYTYTWRFKRMHSPIRGKV